MPNIIMRTFTTLAIWAAIILLLRFAGAHAAVWMVFLMAVVSVHEFNKLMRATGAHPFARMSVVLAGLMVVAPFYAARWFPGWGVTAGDVLALGVVATVGRILGERGPASRVETLASTLFALVYVPFMLGYFARIIDGFTAPGGSAGVLFFAWVVIVAKLCDTGALLTGLACGRHRMTPVISPKKTWEGFAGGVATSALISALFAWVFARWLPAGFTPLFAGVVAVPLAVAGVAGDLAESVIKRRADIKDSGRLAPGIGGMFDLTDSLILAAPVAFWLLRLIPGN